ncbi:MAG: sigma factor-like helix-turn-helix DNA-binding protein, partial [Planctomycetota bacterium]
LHDLDDRRDALLGCLETLPPAQRQLIDLRYTSGLAIDAISQATGRPGASISQTLYRLRNALLNCINRRLNAEGSET